MIKSMTGYGRAQSTVDNMNITVELKSVNHRFFEFFCRVPRNFNYLEEKLKAFARTKIVRGKVEMYVTVELVDTTLTEIEINREYTASYIKALKTLIDDFGLQNDISVSSVARNSDVFKITSKEIDEESVTNAVLSVADEAINAFTQMRITEGERLRADIEGRADFILSKVEFIESKAPETVKNYRERLVAKVKELLESSNIDEQRIITETAIFADKVAVDEETVRLRSHIGQLRKLLESSDDVGKKLDFIVQEMNRETNTIGSKAQNIDIAQCVVDIKSEIEKIREQVQNIE
ncbi:MAG: YicC family protein [Clostridia bacterium]|nr:YicC family protein [Clostridia bacterium]